MGPIVYHKHGLLRHEWAAVHKDVILFSFEFFDCFFFISELSIVCFYRQQAAGYRRSRLALDRAVQNSFAGREMTEWICSREEKK